MGTYIHIQKCLPTLLYGSECRARKRSQVVKSSEMRFLGSVKGCVVGNSIWKSAIRHELNTQLIALQTKMYKERLKENVSKIQNERILKQALKYHPVDRKT